MPYIKMKNISLNGDPIYLKNGNTYLIIDALYLNDIRLHLANINLNDLKNVREIIFPYNEFPYGIINLGGRGFVKSKPRTSFRQITRTVMSPVFHQTQA